MAANYLYIAKTKAGEIEALAQTRRGHKDQILPLFDLSRLSQQVKRFKHLPDISQAYINETAEQVAGVWKGRTALMDAMRWPVNATLTSGEHVLSYFYRRLTALGVRVIPVLGYDRWESEAYRNAMQGLELPEDHPVCLRLESEALNDSAEPEFLQERIRQMVEDMLVPPGKCLVLIDFEDVTVRPLEDLVERATRVMGVLANLGFEQFVTAGCSLPASIDMAVGTPDTTGRVVRREWTLWRTLKAAYPKYTWLYGDYGVRGPRSADDIIAPHANGKIRYTTDSIYYVARGHSLQLGEKGAQMHDLSRKIMASAHFMGPEFSWGDAELVRCSRGEFKGNATKWIAIDTNHHLAWVVQEIAEFVMRANQAKAGR